MNATGLLSLSRMQPATEAEALKRALYYSHSIHLCCTRQLRNILEIAASGQLGPQIAQKATTGVSEWNFSSAAKIMTCVNMHMTGLSRCAANAESWLVQFLFDSLHETDELFSTPMSEDIIEGLGTWEHDKMVVEAARQIAGALGFPPEAVSLLQLLQHFLIESEATGDELLVFALSQPAEALRQHLQTLA